MRVLAALLLSVTTMLGGSALAWSNHALASYRVFEQMPQVLRAPRVQVETLEDFLKAEESALAQLLDAQETWALAHLDVYPARPAALRFVPDGSRSDAQRRLAFLQALRVAPDSRFALFVQADPRGLAPDPALLLAHSAVDTLPPPESSNYRFTALRVGQLVEPLPVLASATDEPDYGLDINLWADSPSEWGPRYGFGSLPFGNPALNYSTQAPFHMGFHHENPVIYLAAPFLKKTFPLLRIHQYSTLAVLAFQRGHAYWGWRFMGLALHYLQDLTQPYHAGVAPGHATLQLIGINALAMAGYPRFKDEMIVLLSNRHLALERYLNQSLHQAATQVGGNAFEAALRDAQDDARYAPWSERYPRDVVSRESHALGERLSTTLIDAFPPRYVSDPAFDFGVHEAHIDMLAELAPVGPRARAALETLGTELMGHFGQHSRNLVRGVLQAAHTR